MKTTDDTEIRRLNWGCGSHTLPGWVNCDIKQAAWIDISCDILEGLPFPDATFNYAVSIHALQEIPHYELVAVLQELRRVLRRGGVLRLCLPDLTKAVNAYASGDSGYFLVPDQDAKSLGGKFIVHVLWYGWSRSLFSPDYIEELLQRAGFSAIHSCTFQSTASDYPEIIELDNRPEESLFIEAVA